MEGADIKTQRVRLLIVDDDSTDILRYQHMLNASSVVCDIDEAKTAAEGIEKYNNGAVHDCVLLDYRLPDMNGIDCLKELISLGRTEQGPVIILTGQGSEDVAVTVLKEGAADYVQKDQVHPWNFMQIINAAIKKQQMENELLEQRKELESLVVKDPLTKLMNRRGFEESAARAIADSKRNNKHFACLFIDLDDFKVVNDTLGHKAGDELLIEVARRIQSVVRQEDLVARLGGDEFVVMLTDINGPDNAGWVANKIINIFSKPASLEGNEYPTSASIGIATFPEAGENLDELMKSADIALYRAKDAGKNNCQFFSNVLNEVYMRNRQIETALKQAIEKKELYLVYQPKYNLVSGKMVGIEALLRWDNPELGMIIPTEFIPIAETTGLMESIGRWVTESACAQFAEWKEKYKINYPLVLSINLSPRQLLQKKMPMLLKEVLDKYALDSRQIELELTEMALFEHEEIAKKLLQELHDMPVLLSIDDFGTGYSSLDRLKQLPIDTLKIDASFVHDLQENESDQIIVKSIISLADNLGIEVMAEGIEDESQLDFLVKNGCEHGQGFYFSEPIIAGKMEKLLSAQQ